MPRPVSNPKNPWATSFVEYLEDPPAATLSVFEEEARSIITENQSPDIFFRFSINPYRGCLHGCAYCYARPTHQYLGFGAGTDFDRKIVVKTNAAELLRRELLAPTWEGESITFSGNTDCYQPLEATYGITRACLSVCLDFQNPVCITTKGALIRRDLELLRELNRRARVHVNFSIAFARDEMAKKLDPFATRPSLRFAAVRALAEGGIPTGVLVSPVIPGLNDSDIPEILYRAHDAGARWAAMMPIRLPAEVRPVFETRLVEEFPEAESKVRRKILTLHGGKMNEAAFGARFTGHGPEWDAVQQLFALHARRLGLDVGEDAGTPEGPSTFRRPTAQLSLFEDLASPSMVGGTGVLRAP